MNSKAFDFICILIRGLAVLVGFVILIGVIILLIPFIVVAVFLELIKPPRQLKRWNQ